MRHMDVMRRALVAGAVLLPAGRAAAQSCSGHRDLMPAFWDVYDRGAEGERLARAQALITGWFRPHIEVYRGAGVGRVDLERWLVGFDPIAGAVRDLSARLPGLWCDRLARFRQALPDAAAEVPALSLVSFGWFDGKARLWQGRVTLFLGLDMIEALHGQAPGALLDHERFHLYHHEVNPSLILPGGDPLWLGIWKEGLAAHATAVLNPGTDRRFALLGDPALAAMGAAEIRRVAAELPDRLQATDGAARDRYLAYGYRGDIPARSGYALGLAVVERAAAGRGLAALARVPAAEAEHIVAREVAALAR